MIQLFPTTQFLENLLANDKIFMTERDFVKKIAKNLKKYDLGVGE